MNGYISHFRYIMVCLCVILAFKSLSLAACSLEQLTVKQAMDWQDNQHSDKEKRECAFKLFEKLKSELKNDPYIDTYYAIGLALKARYSNKTEERIYWSKLSEQELAKVIHEFPDFIFARASRAVSYSQSPPFLELDQKAIGEFEYALLHLKAPFSEPDLAALRLIDRFMPPVLERVSLEKKKSANLMAKMKQLAQQANLQN